MDVSRAFFYAKSLRRLWVELPPEMKAQGSDRVAEVTQAMYGTRDAPLAWQEEITRKLKGLGFIPTVPEPCCFYHKSKELYIVIHVDDFFTVGDKKELEWLAHELKRSYEITHQIFGPDREEEQEVNNLLTMGVGM